MEMRLWFLVTTLLLILGEPLRAQVAPTRTPLVNLDFRRATLQTATPSGDQVAAAEALRKSIPSLKLEFEPVTGSPKQILSTEGFLTGPDGKGDAIASASLAAVSTDDSN